MYLSLSYIIHELQTEYYAVYHGRKVHGRAGPSHRQLFASATLYSDRFLGTRNGAERRVEFKTKPPRLPFILRKRRRVPPPILITKSTLPFYMILNILCGRSLLLCRFGEALLYRYTYIYLRLRHRVRRYHVM